MKIELEFLDLEDILSIHAEQLERFGGMSGIRDSGLLDSAIAAPQASFGGEYLHQNEYEMAAAYAFHIAQNQPFFDGNKRTGVLSALVFLNLNGIRVHDPERKLYEAMISISERKMTKYDLAELLRNLTIQL